MRTLARILLAAAITSPLAFVHAAAAADFTVTLPTVTAAPGMLVSVPITVSTAPAGHGILSINYRLTLDPAVIATSASNPDGFLQYWGTPYVNGTAGYLAASAAGATPLGSASTLLNTVTLRISPTAVLGTNMPLAFAYVLFNEGTPTVALVPGVVQVRAAAADAPSLPSPRLALALASACPVAGVARFTLGVPAPGAPAQLAIYSLDGRRVRVLADGLSQGARELSWDLRDDRGAHVQAGVYFAQLRQGGQRLVCRLVVVG